MADVVTENNQKEEEENIIEPIVPKASDNPRPQTASNC